MKQPVAKRVRFDAFQAGDAAALAALLADQSITRNITCNGSTPARCLASARSRIEWHNRFFEQHGYRVWALRARTKRLAPADRLLGWCGFVPPDDDSPDPEILYAIDREFRGRGLASEAASQAIEWLFEQTDYRGVTAVISTRSNPGSVAVVSRLGMRLRGRMEFSLFLSSSGLADEVVEYEIWRLENGFATELHALIEESAFRAGQLSTVSSMAAEEILQALYKAVASRCASRVGSSAAGDFQALVGRAFEQGSAEAYMDCYHLSRRRWLRAGGAATAVDSPSVPGS
jgi:RimJ/RimL family protein N-acetyltransferase